MTDTVETQIDEILMKHNGELGVTWESPDVVTPDTKQAIKDLIATEVLHARIEELSNLKAEKGRFSTSSYGLWVDGAIDNRIVELEAQLNKGVVQNEHPLEEE